MPSQDQQTATTEWSTRFDFGSDRRADARARTFDTSNLRRYIFSPKFLWTQLASRIVAKRFFIPNESYPRADSGARALPPWD